MRNQILSALSLAALTAAASAQYLGEKPGEVIAPTTNPRLGATGLGNGVTEVGQILLVPHGSLPPGTYYLAATVKRTGGAGGWDGMTGTYNQLTSTFVKDTACDHLNSVSDEFACTVSDDLKTVAMDHPLAGAIWASRAGTTGAFGASALISGVPGGYIDTNFARVKGLLALTYIQGINLMVGDFAGGTVSNSRLCATNPLGAGSHSPSPVNDALGESRALIFSAQVPGRASNAWWTPGMDDSQVKQEVMDTPTWLANPDANGGTFTYAEATSTYTDPRTAGFVAMNSGFFPQAGGNLNLTVFAPSRTSGVPYVAYVILGTLGTSGFNLNLPFVKGLLGLSLAGPLVFLPGIPVSLIGGTASYNVTMPAFAPGVLGYAQCFIVDAAGPMIHLGNTAQIVSQ